MNLRTIIVAAALALPLSAAPASAQFLTFVSAAGNDANTCFVQAAPCKTLQRGINQTSAGGELRLLTSLSSNGFINKSITIEGGYNTVIGTIAVNSASAIVRFRRLNLNGRHAFPIGFNLINAAAVHIEESSAERYAQNGILLGPNVATELAVSNSVIRDNGDEGLIVTGPSSATLTVENSSFENSGDRGLRFEDGRGSISRTVFWGNEGNFRATGGSVTLFDTIAAGGGFNGYSTDVQITLISCTAAGLPGEGLFEFGASSRLSDCVITSNVEGVDGSALTLGNNLIAGNGTDVTGTLTPLAPE